MGFSAGIVGVMMFPLVARAFGIVASIVGIMMVKMDKEEKMDPMKALNRGYYVRGRAGHGGLRRSHLLAPQLAGRAPGLVALLPLRDHRRPDLVAFVYITQYYTEYRYRPVQSIAEASKTGPATNIIAGIGVGLECTWMPVLVMGAAPARLLLPGRDQRPARTPGLFGTAVATMGMLATAAFILAMDTFGPITDNAGGIVEMSEQPEEIRKKTDRLDAVGNTTKALTKGYAIGSAAWPPSCSSRPTWTRSIQYAGHERRIPCSRSTSPSRWCSSAPSSAPCWCSCSPPGHPGGRQGRPGDHRGGPPAVRQARADNDIIQFPKDFKPDYGSCVDIVTKSALQQDGGARACWWCSCRSASACCSGSSSPRPTGSSPPKRWPPC